MAPLSERGAPTIAAACTSVARASGSARPGAGRFEWTPDSGDHSSGEPTWDTDSSGPTKGRPQPWVCASHPAAAGVRPLSVPEYYSLPGPGKRGARPVSNLDSRQSPQSARSRPPCTSCTSCTRACAYACTSSHPIWTDVISHSIWPYYYIESFINKQPKNYLNGHHRPLPFAIFS